MLNRQRPDAVELSSGADLLVHSIFPTIQGEGPFSGQPAVFIRLAGCNLQCPMCDTEYTDGARRMTVEELHTTLEGYSHTLVVITGGEPFRQNIAPLCDVLYRDNRTVQVETNGRIAPQDMDALWRLRSVGGLHVVVSPKTGRIAREVEALADSFKYVVTADDVHEDGLPRRALGHALGVYECVARPGDTWHGTIYVHPADEQNAEQNQRNLEAAVSAVMQDHTGTRRLGLQVHKYAGLE